MQKIPLVDLKIQYDRNKAELDAAVAACLEATSFIGGEDHKAFAREFAAFCGGGHVTLCGNGTDALYLAIREIAGQGDGSGEIITVANTFIATAEAITNAGHRPVFVDVDPNTQLMDLGALERAISSRTKAIIPVHLFGQMVPMDRLMAIADAHRIPVIEDAAQAHGATWQGRGPGQWGEAACFSFYPGKNLGAWGDGGAVLTYDPERGKRIEMRANHGRISKYEHEFEGINSRLDGLQAAVLRVKLRHLAEWTAARRQVAAWYEEALLGHQGITLTDYHEQAGHAYHLLVVRVPNRDAVLEKLHGEGIGAGVHYPVPLHMQPAYRHLGVSEDSLPVTVSLSREILSLPIYPELEKAQVERVAEALIRAVDESAGKRVVA
jgi:dTDP-4-amino-4,6-dideoxygalactose transaminase